MGMTDVSPSVVNNEVSDDRIDKEVEYAEYITAWTIPRYSQGNLVIDEDDNGNILNRRGETGFSLPKNVVNVILISLTYLFLGAVDWRILLELISQGIDSLIMYSNAVGMSIHAVSCSLQCIQWLLCISTVDTAFYSTNSKSMATDVLISTAYLILYFQRHIWLQNTLGNIGVTWDKGLFE